MEPSSTSSPRAVKLFGRSVSINLVLGLIFLLALAVRFAYYAEIHDLVLLRQPVVDGEAYDEWAQRIAAGDWIGSEPFYQDPLYPYLLGAFYAVFGRNLVLLYIMLIVISSAVVFPLYGVGRRSFGDARVGLVAALFWALYKVDFFFAVQIEKTGPGIALVVLGLWLVLALRDRPRVWMAALAGSILGLWPLFRGNLLAVAPVLFGWLAVKLWRGMGRRALPVLAAFVGLCLLPPTISLVRNRAVSGEWIVTTAQGGVNFFVGNYRENKWGVGRDPSWGRRTPIFEQDDFLAEALRRSGRSAMTWSEMDRFWYREGLREIAADPAAWAVRLFRKALILVNRHEVSDNLNYDFFQDNFSRLLKLPWLGFWFAGPVGLAGLIIAFKKRRGGMIALFAGSYAATLMLFYIVDRYRLPLAPVLLVFAAYGVIITAGWARERRWKDLAAPVAAAVLVAGLGFPRWFYPVDFETWQKLGNAYSRDGDWTEAIKSYERALELNPKWSNSWLGYGMALEARLRFGEAREAYKNAVELDPGHAGPHFLYARMLERDGRLGEARAEYERAFELDPKLTEAGESARRLASP